MSISFAILEMFSFIIFSNVFNFLLFLLSFWHPYDLDIGIFADVSESSYTPQYFEFLFLHSVLVDSLFLPYVPNG